MKYIVGAYATAPSLGNNDKSIEYKFYENLIESIPKIRGLEVPFFGKEIHQFGSDFLLGLINIDEGEVLYNGIDLEGHLDDWRSNVAYIPQNIFITDDTLRRNIALGVPDDKINNTKLQEAIQQAQLDELCSKIPNGLEATLGEGGVCLSGGQRQRVALARAFYHDRNVLVMDEATSALDVDTENEVVNEIKNLKQEGDKTIIIIAHRLSTIKHCDYFYKIERGSIVSQGSYDTVVNTN